MSEAQTFGPYQEKPRIPSLQGSREQYPARSQSTSRLIGNRSQSVSKHAAKGVNPF